ASAEDPAPGLERDTVPLVAEHDAGLAASVAEDETPVRDVLEPDGREGAVRRDVPLDLRRRPSVGSRGEQMLHVLAHVGHAAERLLGHLGSLDARRVVTAGLDDPRLARDAVDDHRVLRPKMPVTLDHVVEEIALWPDVAELGVAIDPQDPLRREAVAGMR